MLLLIYDNENSKNINDNLRKINENIYGRIYVQ